MQVHEKFLKERQDNHCGRRERRRLKDYNFNSAFVRDYEPVVENNEENLRQEDQIAELKRQMEELKRENASLKQKYKAPNVSELIISLIISLYLFTF